MDKIWFFEMQDGLTGGFIIADTEIEAWEKLAADRNSSVSDLKPFTRIYSIKKIIKENKSVYDLVFW